MADESSLSTAASAFSILGNIGAFITPLVAIWLAVRARRKPISKVSKQITNDILTQNKSWGRVMAVSLLSAGFCVFSVMGFFDNPHISDRGFSVICFMHSAYMAAAFALFFVAWSKIKK
jgi:hypothetical protein